ncbi:hypothetical protein AB7828_03350 [Tardiphaga sp. 215_C5_N2_1]|uniref:hypothetical protein n=1 Tax=Tardiphaga sp. 215_C5_N2_1 TaxID=3240774 RepID=UPI003F8A638B
MADTAAIIDLHQARIARDIGSDGREFSTVTDLLSYLVSIGVYRLDEHGNYKLIQGDQHHD